MVARNKEQERTRRQLEYVEAVLSRVEAIPPGRVCTYGLLAEAINEAAAESWGGPRQVGRVMALYGGPVPWWRVVHADGTPPHCHDGTALACYREEGTPLRASGKVDMRRALWVPGAADGVRNQPGGLPCHPGFLPPAMGSSPWGAADYHATLVNRATGPGDVGGV
ncbi:MAG TPA: MGMT family protein [Nocardioidaceae bacterium]|nr:MGMT family protein [Nocardioidaceae bacterium]